MKKGFRAITNKIGKFASHSLHMRRELNELSAKFDKLGINLSIKSLRRIWDKGFVLERPSAKTLDRLALLAGFQSWNDLKKALHGDNDGDLNYND